MFQVLPGRAFRFGEFLVSSVFRISFTGRGNGMKLTRLLLVVGFVLLCATWAQAATIPGHFEINLDNNPACVPNPNGDPPVVCPGGWLNNLTVFETTGLVQTQFTPGTLNCQEFEDGRCGDDPFIKAGPGGHSQNFCDVHGVCSSTIVPVNGGGIFDFVNNGPPITELVFKTPLVVGQTYNCSFDTTMFSFCGFRIVSDPFVEALFVGNIPTAAPEPSTSILLPIAFGAMVFVRRKRSRKASA
jgi:hypothetical protein